MKKKISFFIVFAIAISILGFGLKKDNPTEKDPRAKIEAQRLLDAGIFNKNTNEHLGPGPIMSTSVINESFEGATFPPPGWSKLNPDGGPGWDQQSNGTTPMPGWNGGTITTPVGGGDKVAFCTWTTGGTSSNDQWLVTPQITNVQSNDSLKFSLRYWPNSYRDSIEVWISTSTPVVGNFTTLVFRKNFSVSTPDTNWVEYKFRIGNLVSAGANIYIGFREVVADNLNDGASFSLDLVSTTGSFVFNNDIRAQAFVNPLNGGAVGINAVFSPQASFTNNGNNNQANVPVRYRIINSGNVVVYNNTTNLSLNSGVTQTATFPSTSIATAGIYTIKAISELPGDQNLSNDTITGSITVSGALIGDYTIGVSAFNSISGKNITFERVVNKVVKEVWENDDNVSKENFQQDANKEASVVNGRLVKKEVEEISYIPVENGVEYTGSLFADNTTDNLPGSFATLTAAVNALNSFGVSGPVNFLLTDAAYPSETYPIIINQFAGSSSTNTLTIKPNPGVASTFTGSVAGSALIKLNGADYVTINGVNTGGASLTFNNTNTGGINLWVASASAGNGALNNTITNIVSAGPSIGGILSGSGTTLGGDAESPNSNNSITGSTFNNTQNAIYLRGNTTTLDENWVVTGNTIGSSVDATKHTFRGIALINLANANVSLNNIRGVLSGTTSTATMTGISTFINISGGSITRNRISDIYQRNTVGWGANGIGLNSTSTASNLLVANNFISSVRGYGYASGAGAADNGYGIVITAGGGYNVYYNSVAMNVSQNVNGLPAAFNVTSGVTTAGGLNIRNNIFQNTQTTGTERYSVYSGAANTVYSAINYNNYYTTGPNLGFLASNRVNLAAWQTATGQDANSSSVLVNFVDVANNDLHLTGASKGDGNLFGTPIPAVTVDIDGETRSLVNPYKGADEPARNLSLKMNFESCPDPSPVTVQIRSSVAPYNVVQSVTGTAGGNVFSNIGFTNAVNGTSYYLVVKSVNMIETWSASTFTFTSNAASYDFTTGLNKAYGNNMKLVLGVASVYQGDVNQDGVIDATDLILTYNDASTFTTSPSTDFDCNGITDLTDIVVVQNNSNSFIQVQKP